LLLSPSCANEIASAGNLSYRKRSTPLSSHAGPVDGRPARYEGATLLVGKERESQPVIDLAPYGHASPGVLSSSKQVRSVASPPLWCAHRPVPFALRGERYTAMVILGIDAHKRTQTMVAVDAVGRKLGEKRTTSTTTEANLELLRWADRFGPERRFAVEDCRHLSRRLEADLLAAGEELIRVPPKMMAHAR